MHDMDLYGMEERAWTSWWDGVYLVGPQLVTERFRLEGTSRGHLVPPPAYGRVWPDQFPPASRGPLLKCVEWRAKKIMKEWQLRFSSYTEIEQFPNRSPGNAVKTNKKI